MKKIVAEIIGTAVLVLLGCGSVSLTGFAGAMPMGVLPIAFAFGLSVVGMAYAIGPISGCHINPAVTMAMLSSGRISAPDAAKYMVAQVVGGFIGMAILIVILGGLNSGSLGQTSFNPAKFSIIAAFTAEFVATFIFTFVILGATRENGGAGNLAGLVIGLTLTLVHIVFVPVTGSSINPARSIAPAFFAGGIALEQLWIYVIATLLGAAAAGIVFKVFSCKNN